MKGSISPAVGAVIIIIVVVVIGFLGFKYISGGKSAMSKEEGQKKYGAPQDLKLTPDPVPLSRRRPPGS